MVIKSYNYLFNKCLSPQWLAVGLWFSPVISTNKTDCHDITDIVESGIMALNNNNRWHDPQQEKSMHKQFDFNL
jgi:hypothetical protein